ncbi:uncharacterized protein VP01_343g9 [Puccinia sorghi]|uniref:Uncharacterized protein n=1 Tax=Puccinia sorghi TaxID=27349 RepID=A0A0L6UX64_9BASI|nr:uncharacterized protein VP01_343g9 [Puccinia sorghi]
MERGLAIQCHPQQRAIDQVLPIYLKDDTAKMDKTKMTYCGIQVKNRKDDRTASNYMANMTHSNVKINTNDENPYLMLHFSLRDKDTPEESQGPLEKSTNIKNPQDYQLDEPRKQGNRDKKNKQAEQATRQASFLFHGLNSFTFLSPEVKSALHKLLNIRTNLVTRHAGDPVGQLYAKDFMLCIVLNAICSFDQKSVPTIDRTLRELSGKSCPPEAKKQVDPGGAPTQRTIPIPCNTAFSIAVSNFSLCAAFVKLLNQVRMGKVSEQTIEIMASFTKPVKCNDGTLPIKLGYLM